MTPTELRNLAKKGDMTSDDLRRVLVEAADSLEGLERGRLELAILEPTLLQSKNKDLGDMMRCTFGMLYEVSPEEKLGQVTRGCLVTRGYDGKLFIAPPVTKTSFGRKYAPFVWTQALHDTLVRRIEDSAWAERIGGTGGKTNQIEKERERKRVRKGEELGLDPGQWESV